MGFKLTVHWIHSQDPAAPQSNSSFLEIDRFGETATGGIKLIQHFYRDLKIKTFFQGIQWNHQNLNAWSHFYLINV